MTLVGGGGRGGGGKGVRVGMGWSSLRQAFPPHHITIIKVSNND